MDMDPTGMEARGLQEEEFTSHAVPRRSRVALAMNWGCVIGVLAVSMVVSHNVWPYCHSFHWNDPLISAPHVDSVFPSWVLIPIGFMPAVVALLLTWSFAVFPGSWLWELHEGLLTVAIAFACCRIVVDPAKLYTGRLRPDFLAELNSKAGYNATHPAPNGDYCGLSAVRGDRLSFPSGHSAVSFTSMTLILLFLSNRFRAVRQHHYAAPYFGACALPLALAFVVAISRTRTNHHHFSDIVAGGVIGIIAATVAFLLQYSYAPKRQCYIPTTLLQADKVRLPPLGPTVDGDEAEDDDMVLVSFAEE